MSQKGTFMSNCRHFFGAKPGQTPMEFAKELRCLTDKDKAEIQAGMERLGYEFTTPEALAAEAKIKVANQGANA